MTQHPNQFTSNNTLTPIDGVEGLAPNTDNVINLSERRRPLAEVPISVGGDFVIITEPRPTILDRNWNSPPKGTPIWAGFTLGMTREDVLERFPFLTELPSGGLTADCKLFSDDAAIVCRFDDEGGLDSIVANVLCASFDHAVYKLFDFVRFWESEIYPVDRLWMSPAEAIIEKDTLRIILHASDEHFGPHVWIDISASDPNSYEVTEYETNIVPLHRESA
jgi:hypothetical protein